MAHVSGLPSTTVVLIHGLWLSGWALALMRSRIARRGYRALTFSYACVADDLDVNARRLAAFRGKNVVSEKTWCQVLHEHIS